MYKLPTGIFARVIESIGYLDSVTVSLHKNHFDNLIMIDGSNTATFLKGFLGRCARWNIKGACLECDVKTP